MRTDCRHYESRTYSSGEVVHKCRIDVAPEAPWRCPTDCPMFEKRMFDAGWNYGSLAPTKPAPAPVAASTETEDAIAALLNEAEDVINAAAPEIIAEHQSRKRKRLGRRKKR